MNDVFCEFSRPEIATGQRKRRCEEETTASTWIFLLFAVSFPDHLTHNILPAITVYQSKVGSSAYSQFLLIHLYRHLMIQYQKHFSDTKLLFANYQVNISLDG